MSRPDDLPGSEEEYRELAALVPKLSRDHVEFMAEFRDHPKLGTLTPPERSHVIELARQLYPPKGANEQT